MTKYHINKAGKAVKCTAKIGPCPLEGEHFDSQQEAEQYMQKTLANQYGILGTQRKFNKTKYYDTKFNIARETWIESEDEANSIISTYVDNMLHNDNLYELDETDLFELLELESFSSEDYIAQTRENYRKLHEQYNEEAIADFCEQIGYDGKRPFEEFLYDEKSGLIPLLEESPYLITLVDKEGKLVPEIETPVLTADLSELVSEANEIVEVYSEDENKGFDDDYRKAKGF